MTTFRELILIMSVLTPPLIADPAFAGEPASPSPSEPSTGVAAVVVTAQRRAENVQDVPISMSVLQTTELDNFKLNNVQALSYYVPNLLVQQSPANDAVFIRGFGSQATGFAFDQSVSFYQDGIYGGRARQLMEPFFDASSVEVLRGPQGALLGKNTAAGAVNIVTADPTTKLQGSLTADYDFDRHGEEAYGYISGPLTDTFSARLALDLSDLGGYIRNTAAGSDVPQERKQLVRLSLKYVPNAVFDILTKVGYGNSKVLGMNTVAVSPTVAEPIPDTQDSVVKFDIPPRDEQFEWNSSTKANFHIGDYTLTSITGYSSFNDNKSFYGGDDESTQEYAEIVIEKFSQISQEIELFSPINRKFTWIVGAYYDSSNDHILTYDRYNLFGILNGAGEEPFHQTARTISVFGQGTYHITDALRILASVRYTDITKNGSYQALALFGAQPLGGPGPLVKGSIRDDHVDPSVTLQYDFRPGVMVYASYARGSKAGGFVADTQTTTASTFTFKPEQSTNYEIGAKTSWFDNRLLIDLTVYDLKFDDLQVSIFNPATVSFLTENAASATSRGVEANTVWRVTPDLQLSSSFAYLDAKYDKFIGSACLYTEAPSCTPATNNLAGFTLPGASKWTGNAQIDYGRDVGSALRLSFNLVSYWRSSFVTDAATASPIFGVQKTYVKFDGRIQLANPGQHWTLALVGKNLTNLRTSSFSSLWPLSVPPQAVKFLDPTRTISIEAGFKF